MTAITKGEIHGDSKDNVLSLLLYLVTGGVIVGIASVIITDPLARLFADWLIVILLAGIVLKTWEDVFRK